LIGADGQAAGLLSGGCAESDLIERAQRVLGTGRAEIAEFDTRGSDDVIWGIGLGCEGAMRILLSRIDAKNDYQPFHYSQACKQEHRRGAYAITLPGDELGDSKVWHADQRDLPQPVAEQLQASMRTGEAKIAMLRNDSIFVAPVELLPRLLVLGAGADAVPVVQFATALGWLVTVVDHRPAYAVADRFSAAKRVVLTPAAELEKHVDLGEVDAVVVMSHHLPTDQCYLSLLAESRIRYVGLLGPANRRQRLLAEIGAKADLLKNRLAGPVGLDIGAQTPDAIALAIIAEIHAYLANRGGGSFSGLLHQTKNTI
jgi:xanthine dehydrogenase accessory factor